MGGLLVAFVISFTAITVVVVGILAAYAAVTGILYAFAYGSRRRSAQHPRPGPQPEPGRRRLKTAVGRQASDLRHRTSDFRPQTSDLKLRLQTGFSSKFDGRHGRPSRESPHPDPYYARLSAAVECPKSEVRSPKSEVYLLLVCRWAEAQESAAAVAVAVAAAVVAAATAVVAVRATIAPGS